MYSNRLASSRDIAHGFTILHHLRFICSGGSIDGKSRTATTIAAEITPQIIFAGVEKILSLSTILLPFKHSLMELHLDNYSNRNVFINDEC